VLSDEKLDGARSCQNLQGALCCQRGDPWSRTSQIVGLLGPNGAGKSTTFYSVVGIIRPDRGAVILNGENIIHMPMYLRARKGITYLPQEPSVFRKLSVEENLLASWRR